MTRSKTKTFDDLPLFADEASLAEVVMGAGKTSEWCQFAALLEPRGLPKIDELMGGSSVRLPEKVFADISAEAAAHGISKRKWFTAD